MARYSPDPLDYSKLVNSYSKFQRLEPNTPHAPKKYKRPHLRLMGYIKSRSRYENLESAYFGSYPRNNCPYSLHSKIFVHNSQSNRI